MHELPVSMLDFEMAMELEEKINAISSAKNLNELIGGDFLQIRFEVHVSKPLCRGRRVALNDKEKFGFLLSMKSSRIFATGVVRSLIRTKSVKNGLLVKVPLPWINRNMALGFELLPTILGKLVLRRS